VRCDIPHFKNLGCMYPYCVKIMPLLSSLLSCVCSYIEVLCMIIFPGCVIDPCVLPAGCVQRHQARYLLRPETVESLFYMFYVTGQEQYRSWAWAIFSSIRQYARVDGGYAVVENVNSVEADSSVNPRHTDQMDSYFLAETLKYLYLIFAERPQDVVSLSRFLLNTEAHLLPIYSR